MALQDTFANRGFAPNSIAVRGLAPAPENGAAEFRQHRQDHGDDAMPWDEGAVAAAEQYMDERRSAYRATPSASRIDIDSFFGWELLNEGGYGRALWLGPEVIAALDEWRALWGPYPNLRNGLDRRVKEIGFAARVDREQSDHRATFNALQAWDMDISMSGMPGETLAAVLPQDLLDSRDVADGKFMLGAMEIEWGDNQFQRPGIVVSHSAQLKGLCVALHASGRIGKQKNFYPVSLRRDEHYIHISSGGAGTTSVSLVAWQAFVDQIDVRVSNVSQATVPLTPKLVKMARDVKAYRRDCPPTDKEWAIESRHDFEKRETSPGPEWEQVDIDEIDAYEEARLRETAPLPSVLPQDLQDKRDVDAVLAGLAAKKAITPENIRAAAIEQVHHRPLAVELAEIPVTKTHEEIMDDLVLAESKQAEALLDELMEDVRDGLVNFEERKNKHGVVLLIAIDARRCWLRRVKTDKGIRDVCLERDGLAQGVIVCTQAPTGTWVPVVRRDEIHAWLKLKPGKTAAEASEDSESSRGALRDLVEHAPAVDEIGKYAKSRESAA